VPTAHGVNMVPATSNQSTLKHFKRQESVISPQAVLFKEQHSATHSNSQLYHPPNKDLNKYSTQGRQLGNSNQI